MNNKRQDIEHLGVITMLTNGKAIVRIVQNSACSACHAKGACSAADTAEKNIEVMLTEGQSFQIGQQVIITGRSVLGFAAAVYAYLIPFVLLFATLLVVFEYTHSEQIAALASIGSVVFYYFVLYFFKNKLSKKFTFYIK
ncbi:MAG: SoxR reducing system RseC family protein [Paludibacteraceae bacterium]|nr:SoxR reducing system RseC family protein [Paludibacteraceae bacterium]MBN2787319.1 SoxR reducing system RseC family protein [Paludibacteraceae bacterium]